MSRQGKIGRPCLSGFDCQITSITSMREERVDVDVYMVHEILIKLYT